MSGSDGRGPSDRSCWIREATEAYNWAGGQHVERQLPLWERPKFVQLVAIGHIIHWLGKRSSLIGHFLVYNNQN